MKITTILLFISLSCFAQEEKQYVIMVEDKEIRDFIEQFTLKRCDTEIIQFVQDGAGNWITSIENFQNKTFTFEKEGKSQTLETALNAELSKQSAIKETPVSIIELLSKYGVVIEYIPHVEVEK